MFANRVWGLDYSPRKLLSLCCGFFLPSGRGEARGRFEDDGEDSDEKEAVKNGDLVSNNCGEGQKVKSSHSVASYGSTIKSDSKARSVESLAKTDTSEKKKVKSTESVDKKGTTQQAKTKSTDSLDKQATTEKGETPSANGAAYQYDEDTSSDSDDEVLKHYQGLKSSGSVRGSVRSARTARSARSARSTKSVKSEDKRSPQDKTDKTDKTGQKSRDDGAKLAEEGRIHGNDSSGSEDMERVSHTGQQGQDTPQGAESPLVPRSIAGDTTAVPDRAASEARGSGAGRTSGAGGEGNGTTYENRAFNPDLAISGSLSGSQQGLHTDLMSANDEHLFDVSDLQHEPPLISKCGSLEVTFSYEAAKCKMTVTIHRAREIPAKDRGGANSTQVRLMMLPTKKQRYKTKVKEGQEPVYEETFVFTKVTPDEVPGMGLRFRLYGLERMRRERMIGESVIGFASLNLDEPTTHWVILEPRSNLSHGDSGFDVSSLSKSDSASSTQSLQHGGMPELLAGLAYNSTTGRLAVQVIKGSNFRNMAMNRAPDTYVKVTLMSPSGQELQRCKTSVRRGQPNPLFKETFMLQVPLFQLPEVTLMVSVYNKKSMKKKEMIGWFSLGQNSSGEEESSHWADMRESKGEEVCRWHVLLES